MTHRIHAPAASSRAADRATAVVPEGVAERVIACGAGTVSDVELLSLFMRSGAPGRTAVEITRDALSELDGISGFVAADRRKFTAVSGLTDRHWTLLQAALEVSRRHVFATVAGTDVLSSPEQVRHYLSLHLTGLAHEVFAALFLDNRHRVIEYRELFRGTIDSAAVYPREVVKRCLSVNAAAVIFAHNHPSGTAEPSDTDVRLTRKLVDALALVDVRVLDHLIVGQGVQTSLAERGLM